MVHISASWNISRGTLMQSSKRITTANANFKRLGFAILLLSLTAIVHAQPPDTLWTRRIGGDSTFEDVFESLATSDSGYLLVGSKRLPWQNGWPYTVKINNLGDTLWTRLYDFMNSGRLESVIELEDSGFAMAGLASISGSDNNTILIRTDSHGDTLWTHSYGGQGADGATVIVKAEEGGFVLFGYSAMAGDIGGDLYVIRTESTGDTLWTRVFARAGIDAVNSAIRCTDGGYLAAGYTTNNGTYGDIALWRISASGDMLWTRIYGDASYLTSNSVVQLSDGGFAVVGTRQEVGFDLDWLFLRLDSDGDSLWSRLIATDADESAYAVHQSWDRGFAVAGRSYLSGEDAEGLTLIRLDSAGATLWSTMWEPSLGLYPVGLHPLSDGSYVLTATIGGLPVTTDMYLLKTEADPISGALSNESPSLPSSVLISTYPNPFNSALTISLKVPFNQEVTVALYDLLGREVKVLHHGRLASTTLNYTVPATLASGIYFVRATTATQTAMQKVVLLK